MDPIHVDKWANSSIFQPPESDPFHALPSNEHIFFEIIFTLTSVLVFVGNSMVIVVEILGKRSAPNLRIFLINLAISDLLIGVFTVPFIYTDFMLGKWIWYHWLCPVAQFAQFISVFITAFTLTVIGIERFAATLHPFKPINLWLKSNGILILIIGWIFGIFLSLYPLTSRSVENFQYKNQTYYDCRLTTSMEHNQVFSVISFVFTFLLPMIIMIITYGAIGVKLYLYNSPRQIEKQIDRIKLMRKQVFKMLIAVVSLFFICWFPMRVIMLCLYFGAFSLTTPEEYYSFVYSVLAFHWLSMANSFVNPIIYCFMSRGFRADLCDILRGIFGWIGIITIKERTIT